MYKKEEEEKLKKLFLSLHIYTIIIITKNDIFSGFTSRWMISL